MKTVFSTRIGGSDFGKSTEEYKFEKIKRAKREALTANPDTEIIDLGVGEPDKPAHPAIVEVLGREAGLAENRYYADNGITEFQHAAAAYLDSVYNVCIDSPESQIIHGIGSKPILAMLPLAFVDPGDVVINPIPGYPVLATYARYLGAEVASVPLKEAEEFLPVLSSFGQETLGRTKLVYVNYPNNPTGASATFEFFEELVALAREYGFLIVHDAAYGALVFDGKRPLSILTVPGAIDHAVEIHSLSKSYNMTGWRIAFVAGREDLISAYGSIKDNTDSGQFRAIQKAGAFALTHPELIDENRERYSRRFDLLIPALQRVGFNAIKPSGSFYCYMKIPKGAGTPDGDIRFASASQFSDFLIRRAAISTVPWDDAGAYVRMSVTFEALNVHDEKKVIEEVERRLTRVGLVF